MDEKHKEMYVKAVEKSLNDILGETATQLIYNHLEKRCNLKKEDIPSRMKEFRSQLEQILGTAAKIVEKKVDENMKKDKSNAKIS